MLRSNGSSDPVAWFGSYGWRAEAVPIDDVAEMYGRAVQRGAGIWRARPGQRWLVAARRK